MGSRWEASKRDEGAIKTFFLFFYLVGRSMGDGVGVEGMSHIGGSGRFTGSLSVTSVRGVVRGNVHKI